MTLQCCRCGCLLDCIWPKSSCRFSQWMRNESQWVFYWLNSSGSASRSRREGNDERPGSFWRRSLGSSYDARVAQNTDSTARRRGARRREVDLEEAPHEAGDAFVLNWLQRKRAPERWRWPQERADGGQQSPRCSFLLQCDQKCG